VAGSKQRERELARQRWERQQRARAEAKRKTRRRAQIVAASLAVVLVIGGVFLLVKPFGADNKSATAADTVNCTYTPKTSEKTGDRPPPGLPAPTAAKTGVANVAITTNVGEVDLQLDPAKAPCTVHSFLHLAQTGFFNDTTCHRLLTGAAGKVLQCGDPTGTGSGGPGYQFPDENLAGATYNKGTVAMANSGPNTNGSQFFMVYGDSSFPPSYTPFGRITGGMDVLEKIAKGGVTGESKDVPKTKVVIKAVAVTGA
jgi:peptidyl-prolyl cis-trans isomerase B (cyclophilin B)